MARLEWQYLVSTGLIERGKAIPEENIHIVSLKNGIHAKVQGTELYTIKISEFGDEIHCTCPFSIDSYYFCKHLVAVFNYLENDNSQQAQEAFEKLANGILGHTCLEIKERKRLEAIEKAIKEKEKEQKRIERERKALERQKLEIERAKRREERERIAKEKRKAKEKEEAEKRKQQRLAEKQRKLAEKQQMEEWLKQRQKEDDERKKREEELARKKAREEQLARESELTRQSLKKLQEEIDSEYEEKKRVEIAKKKMSQEQRQQFDELDDYIDLLERDSIDTGVIPPNSDAHILSDDERLLHSLESGWFYEDHDPVDIIIHTESDGAKIVLPSGYSLENDESKTSRKNKKK